MQSDTIEGREERVERGCEARVGARGEAREAVAGGRVGGRG